MGVEGEEKDFLPRVSSRYVARIKPYDGYRPGSAPKSGAVVTAELFRKIALSAITAKGGREKGEARRNLSVERATHYPRL